MTEKRKDQSPNAAVMKAIEHIKSLRDDQTNPKSLADIANMLRTKNDFESVDKSTVGRWLSYQVNDKIPAKTRARIISASENLQGLIVTPIVIRFGVIEHATEMLPVHLLEKFEDWQEVHGVTVKLELMRNIAESLDALEDGDVDIAIAPKGFNPGDRNKSVKRFFQISSIKVSGLFPIDDYEDGPTLAQFVNRELTSKGKAVGLLPNADYEDVLRQFLKKHGVKMPPWKPVLDHDDALTKLRAGSIHAVVGHEVFIANVLESARQTDNLRKLTQVPPGLFDNVEMDVFINGGRISAEMARRAYRLLYRSVEHITYSRSDKSFVEKVNEVLGLNTKDAMSGEHVLKEYTYRIDSVDPGVLLEVWKG